MKYDLVIIGGGPAGIAAGIYAARKKIKVALVAESFGGQSFTSNDIQNWIGTKSVSGFELAKMFEGHLKAQSGIGVFDGERILKISPLEDGFSLESNQNKMFETKTILLASGSKRRRLNIPGESEFEGRGVAFCSTCDAPLFEGKIVAVIGGGNAGLEAVLDLLPYAKEIYLLEQNGGLRGDLTTQEKIKSNSKVKILLHSNPEEVCGSDFVKSLKYKDLTNNEIKELNLEGIFVEIGSVPNNELVKDFVDLNERGEVIVDHKTQQSSNERIWAAGDVSDVLYKQNNISAGDAVKAVLNIYEYLQKK